MKTSSPFSPIELLEPRIARITIGGLVVGSGAAGDRHGFVAPLTGDTTLRAVA